MKSIPSVSLSRIRVFSACLLSCLMLMMPIAPMAASANRAAAESASRISDRKQKRQLTPRERLEKALFVNGLVNPAAPPGPIIGATLTDSFIDTNASNKADPGSTVTYSSTISNTGTADATNVTFDDTPDPNTTLVNGSLKISPLAYADAYNVKQNTQLSVAAAGLLSNDTGTPAPTVGGITNPVCVDGTAPFVCNTTGGGTVTVQANGSFTYNPVNAGFTGADTFSYKATNGQPPDDTAVVTITVNANQAPVLANTEPGAIAYGNGSPPVQITNTLTVADADDTNIESATVSISNNFVNGEDQLQFTNQNGITGSYVATTGILTLTGSTTLANYQTALRSINYNNSAGVPTVSVRTITFIVNDGDVNSNTQTRDISVGTNNSAPVVTAGGTLNYTENDAATIIDNTITVNDSDSPNLTGATVQITTNYQNGQDVLSYTTALGITGVFNPVNGTLTLSGTTSLANYQTALRNVKYNNTSENPSTSARTVTWIVNDGAAANNLSAAVTSTINVTAVNDKPVVTAGATLNYTENDVATVIDNTITVNDSDSNTLTGATVQITGNYQNGQDVLSFATIGLISGNFVAATGALTLTGTDTVANYQAALRTVKYNNTSENPSTSARTVTWIVDDGAAANNLSTGVTSTINVTAVNDAPVVTAGGTLNYTENDAATVIDNTITVNDSDSTNLSGATVQITGNYQNGQDVLSYATALGITGVFTAATGTLALSGTTTLANYQTALRNVKYNNTSDNPSTLARTITWIANDGAGANNLSTGVTSTINVTAVNDKPVVTAGATLSYTENAAATVIDNTITVNDVDSANLTGATVQITGNYQSAEDVLSYTTALGISGVYNSLNGTLTLSGTTTVANYQTALRNVKYNNTSDSPSTLARTVTWIVDDGAGVNNLSTGVTSTINITNANDPPVNTVPGAQVVGDTSTLTFSSGAGNQISVADSDAGGSNVQVTVSVPATKGTFVPAGGSGATIGGSGTNSLTITGTLTQVNNALNGMVYTPPSGATQAIILTIVTNDQGNTGSGGAQSDTDTVTINVDQAPVVSSTVPTDLATQVGTQTDIAINFSEPVDVTGAWFSISCASSGSHSAVVTGGPSNYLLNPNSDFANGEVCTVTIFAAQVADQDTNDPPNNMAANKVFSFTTDTPPAVAPPTTPTNGATGVAASTNITIPFNEPVNVTTSSFTIECPTPGNTQAFAVSGSGTNTIVLNPTSDLPAGTICTVTAIAAQISDTDAGDPPDHPLADYVFSFSVPPVAVNDTYNPIILGNVGVNTDTSTDFSILTNDTPNTGVTINTSGSSLHGGTVVVAADGKFTYTPPAGYEGADSFTYTITAAGGTSNSATVSLTVGGMIWFINSAAGAGDGRLATPFNSVASFQAINDNGGGTHPGNGDNIFIYENASSYTGPVSLLSNQKLIGQDATASLATISGLTPPADSFSLPAMNSGNGTLTTLNSSSAGVNAVNLCAVTCGASTNVVRGLTITTGSSSSKGINGSTFGTLSASDIVSISGSGPALDLATGTVNATIGTVSSSGASTKGINLAAIAGGSLTITTTSITNPTGTGIDIATNAATLSFGGTTVNKGATNGTGISIASSSAAVTFTTAALTTNNGTALLGTTSSGAINVTTAAGSSISATGGAAIDITNASGNPSVNLNFATVGTTNSTLNAINLNQVGGAGLTITGATTTLDMAVGSQNVIDITNSTMTTVSISSGGTLNVNDRRSTGINISNASGTFTFPTTNIANPNDAGGYGIRIDTSSAAVTIASATISDAHVTSAQTDGNTDLIPDNDGDGDAIFLKTNTGSFTLSGGTLSNCGNDCIDGRTIQTITLTNVTINTPGQEGGGQGAGGHGISFIDLTGTSNLTGLFIQQFLTSQTDGFRTINTNKNATINVINCRFENSAAAGNPDGNDGLFFEGRGTSNMTTVVDEASPDATHFSRFQGLFGDGIQISTGNPSSGTMNTTVKNTDFKDAYQGATQTGSGNNGLRIAGVGSGKHFIDIQNNTFTNVNKPLFAQGVISVFINNNSEGKGTIANNTITNATQAGIQVFADNLAGETITDMDFTIQNNTIDNVSSQGILVQMTVAGGTLASCDFRILNNNIGQTTPVGDGEVLFGFGGGPNSSAEGILMSARGTSKTCRVKIASNNVKINANGVNTTFPPANEVLELDVSENAFMSATVQNNSLLQLDDTTNGAAFFANVFNGGFVGTPSMCLDFTGNTGNTNVDFFILEQATNGTISIENIATYQGTNTGTFSTSGNLVNSAGCTEPPVGITQLWVPDRGPQNYVAPGSNASPQQPSEIAAVRVGTSSADPAPVAPRTMTTSAQPTAVSNSVTSKTAAPARPLAAHTSETVKTAKAPASAQPKAGRLAERTLAHHAKSKQNAAITAKAKARDDKPMTPAAIFPINLGTIPAGKSVTITFQVTLNNAMPFGTNEVSNQGKVTYDGNPGGVLTDDPSPPPPHANGPNDPTFTPIDSPTANSGNVSGQILDQNGQPVEGAGVRMTGTQNRLTVTDANGNYHFDNVEANGFYNVTPTRANFLFSPNERSFTQLGNHTDAVFTGSYNGGFVNPLDTTEYFVRQQYVDFLNREPDEAGFNFWYQNIEVCGADQNCRAFKRSETSAAFFLSVEFQQTGYLVYKVYQSAYGDMPGTPVPLTRSEFKPDTAAIGNGLIVNQPGWETVLENNKQAFTAEFVTRARFTTAYPTTMSPAEFVDKLFLNAGVTPSDSERTAAIAEFNSAADTSDTGARSKALRRVAENPTLNQQEFNSAFVLMQYFGYLKRSPNDAPEVNLNYDGYTFWLQKLDHFDGNFRKAEMVKSFLVSGEYRERFPK